MSISRRRFLRSSGLITTAFLGLRDLINTSLEAAPRGDFLAARRSSSSLLTDPRRLIDLPPGFSYRVLSECGEVMDDGLRVPGKHDGMAAFPGPGRSVILIRNHELDHKMTEFGPFGRKNVLLSKIDRKKIYDPGKGKTPGLGGTTTVVYDLENRRVQKHFLSLIGTHLNCAGGPTPWNSWITCEESGQAAEGDIEKDHGYNFEIPASAKGLVSPTPLKAMGRFRHEAIAVDPETGIVYQTEDRPDGNFYRCIPEAPRQYVSGGRLQVLRVRDKRGLDTRNWSKQVLSAGETLDVEWVDLENVESPEDDLRYQGRYEKGAARFARGEGIWFDKSGIFFACTNGGKKKKGQIWKYIPSPEEGRAGEQTQPAKLELFLEPTDSSICENADNLTMSPWGDLVVCEDGVSPQFLLGVTPEAQVYKIARTTVSEFAGATFSPDGTTLFVNIQTPGITVAITGPWNTLTKKKV